jgi:hypothetical protein
VLNLLINNNQSKMEIKIEKVNAVKAYQSADDAGKKLLTNLLGAYNLLDGIMERVKSYEDACAVLGIQQHSFLISTDDPFGDNAACVALQKLTIISRALNEGWTPDWSNSSQYKYYPYFKANPAGSGLSFHGYDGWLTDTNVGSRLCFKSAELARYAGEQFIDLYNDFLTIKQS